MIKSIKTILSQDKEKFVVPKKVQDLIPIKCIWPDGIFKVGNKFSKTYKFSDINYMVASREDKESMFLTYSELLNSLDSGATTKITINNHRLNKADFEDSILMPMKRDGLDGYRMEYNNMLLDKATGANGITQEKYVTISVSKKDIEEARAYFARVGADLTTHFTGLGSKCVALNAVQRLRILHDFYRPGDETAFEMNINKKARMGHDFRDYICPDSVERSADHIKLGEKFARVLFLKDYASYIKDSMLSELTELNRNLMLSIDVIPIPTDEAVREVENRLLGVETNITNWQRKQNQNNNFSAVVPYDMELQRKESKEFLDDLTTRDQRMMFAVVTMVITADTKEQLDLDTETILSTARKHMCQMATLKFQQTDGLNTVLPIGVRKINTFRTLTTESLAVLMPFKVQEIMDQGGIYFGENAISHNLIMCNKANLLNQSAFLLGVPGSGKSFSAKELITFLMLNTDDDILICDPEGEYAPLVEAMGNLGSVIRVSAGGRDRLNAMYMVDGYGENNPIVVKSEFIMSLIEQIDKKGVGPQHKSIIDRCITNVYRNAAEDGTVPTLCTLRDMLLEQPEPEAKQIALSLELYTTGSLDIFGKQSNWKKGKRTHVFIDEFHVVFENEFSAQFFNSAWRQFRKRNAYPTAITQNVEYLLDSVQASTMLSNSEFVIMLNQAASDREKLARLLNISNEQMSYITNADAGCGLIKYGSALVPFINQFPHDTKLYQLMTTRPGEGEFMKIKKIIGIAAIVVLCGIAVFSGVVFHHQYQDQKNSAQQFEDLSNMIADVDKSELDKEPVPEPGEDEPVSETLSEEELAAREAELAMEKYRALFNQNSDFVGWISIDGTNINYPVMWTPNNPNYYLKHSFEKEYSDYGVPYIDEDCVMGESNNYVIYGHHMKNETMFHDLCNYASKDFYDEHPIIKFDTLFGFGEYQIVAVFRFDTNNDTFRYNQFTDMDEEHFKNFMNSVHLRQLYDTGVDAEYGDHLITLSTCEYTYTNGRFVVVAKKV